MIDQLFQPTSLIAIALIGSLAGILGGLLGVGGSVIIIPSLYFVLGSEQQLFQAAAMIVNVFIAIPAAYKHYKKHGMVPRYIAWMLPASITFIVIGVSISNLFTGQAGNILLGRILAAFLAYVLAINIKRLLTPRKIPHPDDPETPDPTKHILKTRAISVGSLHGFTAGLMGIGGGAVTVPMQQIMLKLPLKNCIANSSALIIISSIVGAAYKNLSLPSLGYKIQDSITIAAVLIPTAFIASRMGAQLTHILPTKVIRILFMILITIAAIKLANLPSPF
ncbi:Sulfite exporter TauE/SafE [Poriferisphaera corsica]|uniref:Probable membrane transporter protein n=1 Tax=Poriferisphaera corsica TaxID=2528020 RepID=A0A517YXG2_9BACT|nr:sulfite exporter TauE/SafE family protein [Poriferisphaera corsica]QDU34918.1 Sulfite exporter TauE/SafE [Poriferisphaera corsica]